MSAEDFEALRAEYAAMSRKDWNAVLGTADRDFELMAPRGGLDAGMVRGVKRARRAFEDFFSPYEEVSVEPEAFFEGNGQIVVFFLQRARPVGSTALVERRAAHLWTMRDGKATRLEIFPQREKALEAAASRSRRCLRRTSKLCRG
jgi:ketosteroid isomerase-like protein